MAIDFTSLPSSQTASTRARASEQGNSANKGSTPVNTQAPSSKGDTVKLSDAAQALQNVEKQLANTPDVDSNRVEQLRQEIDSGSYQVNSSRVAQGMLNIEKLFS
jgi:negative regulator of flagellin synthesis FlgM